MKGVAVAVWCLGYKVLFIQTNESRTILETQRSEVEPLEQGEGTGAEQRGYQDILTRTALLLTFIKSGFQVIFYLKPGF